MGRLPEAYLAPPAVRELREPERHPAKLVALRSGLKAQVHAVLARHGVLGPVSDLFGIRGRDRPARLALPAPGRRTMLRRSHPNRNPLGHPHFEMFLG